MDVCSSETCTLTGVSSASPAWSSQAPSRKWRKGSGCSFLQRSHTRNTRGWRICSGVTLLLPLPLPLSLLLLPQPSPCSAHSISCVEILTGSFCFPLRFAQLKAITSFGNREMKRFSWRCQVFSWCCRGVELNSRFGGCMKYNEIIFFFFSFLFGAVKTELGNQIGLEMLVCYFCGGSLFVCMRA